MQVNKVIKNEDGSADVKSQLTPDQLTYVVAVGLNTIMKAGAFRIAEAESAKGEGPIV